MGISSFEFPVEGVFKALGDLIINGRIDNGNTFVSNWKRKKRHREHPYKIKWKEKVIIFFG
ncbi:hypothetical protein A7K93_10745 [Candidatus Methylacidiphilum fumarolicum]|nr:hypothetical protein A7K73_08125 [Candidatus Methylacidiphilum fumarolicum]TFE71488.1 hypothetical protein A7K93_10745 [Candidatus Methylacidiphilum fumarolicum]TFE72018.1 hypothetical protein A7K72_09575 [Candidatus Methylacidiphilum fumarolicum]TFE75559.1 hypothetical protein A7D33_10875 [Candidatus Methylacidiphilum fumarolicum]